MSLVNHPIKKESNNAGSLTKQYMSINIDCLEIKLNMGQKKRKKIQRKYLTKCQVQLKRNNTTNIQD